MSSLDPTTLARLTGQVPHVIHQAALDKVEQTCNAITGLPKYSHRSILIPNIEFDVKGTTAGWASGGKTIRLNPEALMKHTEDMIEQTIPHEVAHIAMQQWYPNQNIGHGALWQILMVDLGLPPSRCHQYDLTKARRTRKFIYTCACAGREHKIGTATHNRIRRGAGYHCTKCHADLIYQREATN